MMIDIESQLKIIYGNYLDFAKGEIELNTLCRKLCILKILYCFLNLKILIDIQLLFNI